jgi:hypothetical protein
MHDIAMDVLDFAAAVYIHTVFGSDRTDGTGVMVGWIVWSTESLTYYWSDGFSKKSYVSSGEVAFC